MDLTLTEDQELVRRTAREFLDSRAGDGLWKEIVELGWTGLAFDESLGGGYLEACLLAEELGRVTVPTPFAAALTCGMAVPSVREEVSAGRVYVPAFAAPDGVAELVPYAESADGFVVTAPSGVHVVARAAEVSRQDVIGPAPKYRVRFADLGEPVEAAPVEAFGAATLCAEMVGGAQAVLDRTVSYATQRTQFGRPIGSFQAVQHHCANMAIDVLGARFTAYEAIWRLGRGLPAETEVAVAKSWVGEAYQRVCALGHQVHGAIGFTAEHDLHHYTRHAIASALTFGDPDTHLDRLATLIGL